MSAKILAASWGIRFPLPSTHRRALTVQHEHIRERDRGHASRSTASIQELDLDGIGGQDFDDGSDVAGLNVGLARGAENRDQIEQIGLSSLIHRITLYSI